MDAAHSLQMKSLENSGCKHISLGHSKLQCSVLVVDGFVFWGWLHVNLLLLSKKPVEVVGFVGAFFCLVVFWGLFVGCLVGWFWLFWFWGFLLLLLVLVGCFF